MRPRIRPSPPPAWRPGQSIQSKKSRRIFLEQNLAPTPPSRLTQRRKDMSAQERHIQLMIQNRQMQNEKAANPVNRNVQSESVANRRLSAKQPMQTLWRLDMTPKEHGFHNRLVPYHDNKLSWQHKARPFHQHRPNINIWTPLKPTPTEVVARTERPKQHGLNHHFDEFLHRIQEPAITGRVTLHQTLKPTPFKYTATPTTTWLTHIKPRFEIRTESPSLSLRNKAQGHVTQVISPVITTEHPLLKRRRIQLEHFRRKNETIARQRELAERLREQQLADIREQQRALKLKIQLQERRRNRQRQFILDPQRSQSGFRSRPIVVHQPSPRQRQAWQSFIQLMLRSPLQ